MDSSKRKFKYKKIDGVLTLLSEADIENIIGVAEQYVYLARKDSIVIDDVSIFVKRVPLSDVEYENISSTGNIFSLPQFYHYNLGSMGFGAQRELMTHIRATEWVLNGECENFPLMYHYRVMKKSRPEQLDLRDNNDFRKYVEKWNGDSNVASYISGKYNSQYELVMFFEHFDSNLHDWLLANEGVNIPIPEINKVIDFLHRKGVYHFDAHSENILISHNKPYITDFGLAVDKNFELDQAEHAFVESHSLLDYAECIGSFIHLLRIRYENLDRESLTELKFHHDIDQGADVHEALFLLVEQLDEKREIKHIPLPHNYVDFLKKYKKVIFFIHDFYQSMNLANKKNVYFDNEKLHVLLIDSGICHIW